MVPVGGHNLLEPAGFGCPVLFGQYTHNFDLMARQLANTGGGIFVETEDDLYSSISKLLSDSEALKSMGSRARDFVEKNEGALYRIMDCLGGYIGAP